jgi:hypothetical protein
MWCRGQLIQVVGFRYCGQQRLQNLKEKRSTNKKKKVKNFKEDKTN